jgi:hypothetical protein
MLLVLVLVAVVLRLMNLPAPILLGIGGARVVHGVLWRSFCCTRILLLLLVRRRLTLAALHIELLVSPLLVRGVEVDLLLELEVLVILWCWLLVKGI